MAADKTVAVELVIDDSGAITSLRQIDSSLAKIEKNTKDVRRETKRTTDVMRLGFAQVSKVLLGMRAVMGGIRRSILTMRVLVLGFFIKQAFQVFSQFIGAIEEFDTTIFRLGSAVNAAQKRFGTLAGTVERHVNLIKILRKETNQYSRRELAEVVAGVAELERNFGLSADQGEKLTRRILDIAAATGRTLVDVITRIRSGFLGSTEAIEDLGVNFKIFRLQQDALNEGLVGQFVTMTDVKQAQVRFNVVMKDTIELEGILAKSTDTISGRMRAFKATFSDLVLLLSNAIVNTRFFNTIFNGLASIIGTVTGEFDELTESGKKVLGVMNLLLGLFGGVLTVILEIPGALKQTSLSLGILAGAGTAAVVALFAVKAALGSLPTPGEVITGFLVGAFAAEGVADIIDGDDGFFTILKKAFKSGSADFQLTMQEFASDAASIFGDTFGKRLEEPLPIEQVVKSLKDFTAVITERLVETRTGGLLEGLLFFDPNQLETQIQSTLNQLNTVKSRITDALANVLPDDTLSLSVLQGQENQVLKLVNRLIDLRIVLGAIANDQQTNITVTDQLSLALNNLGLSLENVVSKGNQFKLFWKEAESTILDITVLVKQAMIQTFTALGELFAGLVAGEGGDALKKFFAAFLGMIGDFMIALGTALIPLALALLSLKSLNPVAMLAVAGGLIVVGSILKGFASRLGGATGGGGGLSGVSPTGPEAPGAININLAGINPQQGIPQAAQRLADTQQETNDVLEHLANSLDRFDSMPVDEIVTTGVRKSGGIRNLLTSKDKRSITQSTFNTSTANSF